MKTALVIAAAFVVITTAANADGYRAATKFEQSRLSVNCWTGILLVLKALTTVYREELAQTSGTFYSAARRCVVAARIYFFQTQLLSLIA